MCEPAPNCFGEPGTDYAVTRGTQNFFQIKKSHDVMHESTCHVCEQWNGALTKHDIEAQEGCLTHNFTRTEEQSGVKKSVLEKGYQITIDDPGEEIEMEATFEEFPRRRALPSRARRHFTHSRRSLATKPRVRKKRGLWPKFDGEWKKTSTGKRVWANVQWQLPRVFHFMSNYERWEEEAMGGWFS